MAPTPTIDTISEARKEGTAITGSATDPGSDMLSYAWTVTENGSEYVGTGASFTFTPDDDGSYLVELTASDDDGGSKTVEEMIEVENVAPTIVVTNFTVEENSAGDEPVGQVVATDPGADTLTYAITGGTGATAFQIDANTGGITVADPKQLDYETTTSFDLNVTVSDGTDSTEASVTVDLLNQASIMGTVYVDANLNGVYDANKMGTDGVIVELLDELGQAVLDDLGEAITAVTNDGGFYLFEELNPGDYQLAEVQPTGVTDGDEQLGSVGGTFVTNDVMGLTLGRDDAYDYIFAEIGQQVASGDTASIGFWQNKHGQSLIKEGGETLADWLSDNFSNIFGDELEGADGGIVACFYKNQLFKQKGKKAAGPAKVDAQFMAVALSTYFTSRNYAGSDLAAQYGFNVTDTGIATRIVNVGTSGAAFSTEESPVADYSDLTIMQLLTATDSLTDRPNILEGFAYIYDANGDGVIDETDALLRTKANEIFSDINEQGDI